MAQTLRTGDFQFKVFLVKQLSPDNSSANVVEVRRYIAQVVGGPGALGVVCNRIEEYLTSLQGKTYSLFWKDEDGDFIKVSSDQEIVHAITIMHSLKQLVSLYAMLTPISTGAVHPSVTCDGCQVFPVQGNRYKCVECNDYDLCAACEGRGVHPEHAMIRFSEPVFPGPLGRFLKRRMRRHMKEAVERRCGQKESEEEPSASDDEGRCPFEKRGRHHKGEKHHKKHHHHKERSHCRDAPRFLNEWEMFRRDGLCAAASSARDAAHAAATAAAAVATDPNNVAYLRNVGQNICKFLDPLGAATPVQQTQSSQATAGQATAAASTQQPDAAMANAATATESPTAPAPPSADPIQNLISVAVQNAPSIMAAVQQITDSLAQQHVDGSGDGWTVLNAEDREPSPRVSAPESMDNNSQSGQQQTSPTSEAARLYPDLAPGITTPATADAAAATSAPAPHPNPMVQRTLETLTGMGFSNEGNLLTQLLEIHNGDIYKALDVLQVIRK